MVRVDTVRTVGEDSGESVVAGLSVVHGRSGRWLRVVVVNGHAIAPHDAFALAGAIEGAARQAQSLGSVALCKHGQPTPDETEVKCWSCQWERENPERAAELDARIIKDD